MHQRAAAEPRPRSAPAEDDGLFFDPNTVATDQMFSWLAEALTKFGELNAMTMLEVAQEDESVEGYIDLDLNDPTSGGFPTIEPSS